jgi:hypothetical protein
MPDFWGFLQQQEARLREDFSRVTSEEELESVRRIWLDPVGGILQRIKDDPYFSLAKPNAKKIFQEYIRDRIELESRYCREIWNL